MPVELKALVDREEALSFLGHAGQSLGADLGARLGRAAALCEGELAPRGVYRVLPASEALALLPGRDIAAHLEGCTEVALMAVTLGVESEMVLRREAALSATDGLLVDACASSLVEQAAGALNEAIEAEAAARGLDATWRFSPGYGDLPLSCQPAFLAACGADRALGLTATEAYLLVPSKSITAVVGLRPRAGISAPAAKSPCFTCPICDTCALRAQGRTCHGNPA
ncbi:vitamin B12 dependent methionine synthase [uncultured Adlercreutzia sp.]|uniref:vitamin B12 dependent methionine synthase n=1 Tax=uncultured Adlercreutzia sp. TaxID=875803 RepID=UPI0026F3B25B|nr:vitamin B12 dependent methionine synthase [uncultured Adlercreutzia sp.]